MDDEVRNLVPSTLYQENACTSGHAAVWGSYYDPERKAWGYSCCRRLQRQEACPLAEAQEVAAESSDEEDPAEAAQRVAWQESKLLDAAPPSCLLPREQHATEEDFLTQFVLYWYHHWTNSDKSDQKGQTREAFLALLKQLHRKSVDRKLLRQMADFAHLAQGREYAQANDVYIDITIGRAPASNPNKP
ncbi:unnamed protein product [Effrenium voratum]|nr:unnamed protein product [Effrenium voratum]